MNRLSRLSRALIRTGAHYNPKTEQKVSWWDRGDLLGRYRGRADVFGSFTHLLKLGINPRTKYKTPVGIYAYPIDLILIGDSGGEFEVPFQGDAPYLHIFQVSNLDRSLIFRAGDDQLVRKSLVREMSYSATAEIYNQIEFPYEDRLKRLYVIQTMSPEDYINMKIVVLAVNQRVVCDQAFVWNFTRHLSGFNPKKWTGLLRQLGFVGALDYGTKTIHPNEPTQAVFFDPGSVTVLDALDNATPIQTNKTSLDREISKLSRSPETSVYSILSMATSAWDMIDVRLDDLRAFHSSSHRHVYRSIEKCLTELFRVYGWMNHHAAKDPVWSSAVRDDIVGRLRSLGDKVDSTAIRNQIDKLIRLVSPRV